MNLIMISTMLKHSTEMLKKFKCSLIKKGNPLKNIPYALRENVFVNEGNIVLNRNNFYNVYDGKGNFLYKTKLAIILASLFLVALFTTFSDSSPWVKSIDMVKDESCSLFQFKVNGDWLYYVLNGLTIVALITWITIIVVKTFKEKGREFKVFRYLLCLALIPLFIWIFSVLKILPSLISNEICFMIVLLIVMHVEIFYSIKYDPKKYVEPLFNSTACGIIILDSKKRYIHSNNKAKEFFSILNMDNKDAITAFININIVEETVYFDGKYNYTINVDTIKDNNNPRIGYAVWVDREEIIEENKEAE